MVPQSIIHIPEICHRLGVQSAILSPGSRSAPLSLAFARHPQIVTEVIDDERAAAFVGFGRALAHQAPVALVCTSGSAGYNYAPAVAEAYFQQVPMLIFTADRPPEWIDQWDGQTIRQENLYGRHVKASFSFPVEATHPDAAWQADRMISEAIISATTAPMGPVHVNVPLREPFYPAENQVFTPKSGLKVIHAEAAEFALSEVQWFELAEAYKRARRVLVVAGQTPWDHCLRQSVKAFSEALQVPVITDVISNLQGAGLDVHHQDVWLGALPVTAKQGLAPDLVISLGKSVISKQFKLWLRAHRPAQHWHIQPFAGVAPDPFQSLNRVVAMEPGAFLKGLAERIAGPGPEQEGFTEGWRRQDAKARAEIAKSMDREEAYSEYKAVYQLMQALPENMDLHLANSMAVRYANYLGLGSMGDGIRVFANRGTSGIDGSNSTQRGAYTGRLSLLLTGDMAFFYDRNAWWDRQPGSLMRVVVLNNHGGGIFRMIKGPRQLPELSYLFDTEQPLSAEGMAKEWGMEYHAATTALEVAAALPRLLEESAPAQLLEVFTDKETNTAVLDRFKQLMRETYGA